MNTPKYIKQLLIPNGTKPTGRKVWSIDLETVWLPFFHATNIMGDTQLPADALGAPLRLQYNADGTPKFSKAGKPQIKVVKELADGVSLVKANFIATISDFSASVINGNPEAYQSQIAEAQKAGHPIITRDKANIAEAVQAQMLRAIAEAEGETTPAPETAPEPGAGEGEETGTPPEAESEEQPKSKRRAKAKAK